jgi:hypothetical protein
VGKSSEAYKSIGGGSPIVKYTQAQVPMRWWRIMMIMSMMMIMRTMIMRIDGDDVMRVINMSMIRAANITINTTITTIIIIIHHHHHHYAVRFDSRDAAVKRFLED